MSESQRIQERRAEPGEIRPAESRERSLPRAKNAKRANFKTIFLGELCMGIFLRVLPVLRGEIILNASGAFNAGARSQPDTGSETPSPSATTTQPRADGNYSTPRLRTHARRQNTCEIRGACPIASARHRASACPPAMDS